MSKRILLIGGNYAPELTGIGKYNGEMMQWFAQHGLDVTVLTTYPYYPQWSIQPQFKKQSSWFSKETKTHDKNTETIIRCPHYVPANPTGLKRLLSDTSIFASIFFALLSQIFKKKHDYVLCVAPPFSIGLLGLIYSRLRGSKSIYHIQDLQVDAARDLNMIRSKAVIKMLFAVEHFILKHADVNSTISPGMQKKVEQKCSKKVQLFPNWVDVDAFFPIQNKLELKEQFGFNSSDKIILYSGAIGEKQGLEMIIESAKALADPCIKFVISGMGPFKEVLVGQVKKLGLNNVHFVPLQPADRFNLFLNMADVHLVLQKANASDLVLPSKLSTILAVGGVAIVTANANTSLYNMMKSVDMGFVIPPEKQGALNEAIANALLTSNESKRVNARLYAQRNLSIHSILSEFCHDVLVHKIEAYNMVHKQQQTVKTFLELAKQ